MFAAKKRLCVLNTHNNCPHFPVALYYQTSLFSSSLKWKILDGIYQLHRVDRLRIFCRTALRGVMSIFCVGREVAESEGTA